MIKDDITIKDAIRNKINSVSLSEQQLRDLQDIEVEHKKTMKNRYCRISGAIFCSLIFISALLMLFLPDHNMMPFVHGEAEVSKENNREQGVLILNGNTLNLKVQQRTDIYTLVIREVVYNHKVNKLADVKSKLVTALSDELPKLGFTLIDSYGLDNFDVISTRYCSLSGAIAAQLSLVNKETKGLATFYQTKIPPMWKYLKVSTVVDSIIVDTWVEDGLLMAVAYNI